VRLGFPVELVLIGVVIATDAKHMARLEHEAHSRLGQFMISRAAGRTEWFDCQTEEARAILAEIFR
jgi:hypothetical protein